MARRRNSSRRRRRGSFGFLYKVLSVFLISGTVIAALTLFFRVDTILVTGAKRYTQEDVIAASGIEFGDNLYLLNKPTVVRQIQETLPYIERVKRIDRKLPDTLLIEVTECGTPLALVQDGGTWLISPRGKIVEMLETEATGTYSVISGCRLLSPAVGTPLALATEYSEQETSLLELIAALENAGMLASMDAIRMDELDYLSMDYMGRFTVRLPYGADYAYKLRFLQAVIDNEKIQDNMTGTIDMRGDDGRVNFIQNVR